MKREKHILKVVRCDEPAKMFVVEFEDHQYRVHMVAEQIGKGNPGEILCEVKRDDNWVYITQDMEALLRNHYKEGDEVTYRIEKVAGSFYYLCDQYGYHTYLDKKVKINPDITPQLKCRIKKIGQKHVNVELVEKISLERSRFMVNAERLKQLFAPVDGYADRIVELLLADNVAGSFDAECNKAILDICRQNGADKKTLADIKAACFYVLEETNLLRESNDNEREVLQQRFTTLIEQIGYYVNALEHIERGDGEKMVTDLLRKLRIAGFVYHPTKMFYIMMCIFLIKSKDSEDSDFIYRLMPDVFDTLRSCSFDHWQREPFKTVWVKLLNFFISIFSKDQDRLHTDKEALAGMVQALALQYNLTANDKTALADDSLNLAMLYRYCTFVGVIDPQRMLDVAYRTLIGEIQDRPYLLQHTADPARMVNILYNQVKEFIPDAAIAAKYEGTKADIVVVEDGIRILPKEYDEAHCCYAMPDYLTLKYNLQVGLHDRTKAIPQGKRRTLAPYRELWHDIYMDIMQPVVKMETETTDSKPVIGETYGVIVTRQTGAETPTFECRIVDPEDVSGKGTIRMADMVGYITAGVGLFSFEKDGKPLVFDAIATGYDEETDSYTFESKEALINFCDEYRYDNINYTDHLFCVVTGGNTLTPFYAVNQQGFSMSIKYDGDTTPIQMPKGTVIEVTSIEQGKSGFMQGVFVRIADEEQLTLADAFGNLMRLFADKEPYDMADDNDQEEEEEVQYDIMELPQVRELVNIIDSVASLENDYILAYNYLGFARLMAMVMEDDRQVEYYESKQALIELVYAFDVNNNISEEKIEEFEQNNAKVFAAHSALSRQFRKLQIISYMGHDEKDEELCQLACQAGDAELPQLARLVISYNFMNHSGMAAQATEIHNHIKEILKLQKKENPKKDYGQETFIQEFKSSIVFPPDNGMRPDPVRQTRKIMEEICAFLNAEGGKLYIGVDDKTHLEKGIEEDLKHPLFTGSTDKYDNYVHNQINLQLGELADHCVSTYFDEEAKETKVYVIDIKPCNKAVSIDGEYYERRGTSSRHVSEEYLADFLTNRSRQISKMPAEELGKIIAQQTAPSVPTADQQNDDGATKLDYSTDITLISTSKTRIYKHKDDDLQPDDLGVYINIFSDNTYSVTPQYIADCLSLGIYDDEQEEGVLIVVYANGEMSKISIAELLKTDMWTPKKLNNKSELIFISPAMPDDMLTIRFHSKNTDYYRCFSVDKLKQGTFTKSMRPFYNGQIDSIEECEILHVDDFNTYRNMLDLETDSTGVNATKTDGKRVNKAIKQQRGEK